MASNIDSFVRLAGKKAGPSFALIVLASFLSFSCISGSGPGTDASGLNGFRIAYPRARISLFGERSLIVASEGPMEEAPCELSLDGRVIEKGTLRSIGAKWGYANYAFDLSSPLSAGNYRLSVDGLGGRVFTLYDDALDVRSIMDSFWAFQRASSEKCQVEGELDYQGNHHVADSGLPRGIASNWGQNKRWLPERSGDMSGGWHDATSTDKDTFDQAGAVAMLGIASGLAGDGPDRDAILAEMDWGVDYLMRIQNSSGSFPFSINPYMPWDGTGQPRHVVVNEVPGVAANAARALAIASVALASRDKAKSGECLSAARRAFDWARAHTDDFGFFDLSCMWTGGAVSLLDAAGELYRATGEPDYADYAEKVIKDAEFKDLVFSRRGSDPRAPTRPGGAGGPGGFPGQFDRAMNFFETCMLQPAFALCRYREAARPSAIADIDRLLGEYVGQVSAECLNPYGICERSLDPSFGPNIFIAGIAHEMAWIALATGDESAARLARDHYAWTLGRNPWGSSFYFGIGGPCALEPYGRKPEEAYGALLPGPLLQKDGKLTFEFPQYNEWRIREAGIGVGNSAQFSLDFALSRLSTSFGGRSPSP